MQKVPDKNKTLAVKLMLLLTRINFSSTIYQADILVMSPFKESCYVVHKMANPHLMNTYKNKLKIYFLPIEAFFFCKTFKSLPNYCYENIFKNPSSMNYVLDIMPVILLTKIQKNKKKEKINS